MVAKARVDQHPKYNSIRQGRPLQRTLAWDLQNEAKVPFGPCSYDALTAFSQAPSLTGYQIILVDAQRSFHITTFGPLRDKQLILLHNKDHYDVITRLPGFFGSSYVCADCWKPYNTEGLHRCTKNKLCGACRQKDCVDFFMPTPDTSKPLTVASRVIGTFSDPRVWKPMPARPMLANPPRTPSPPCALNDTDALTVINKMWACPAFNVTIVTT